MHIDHIDKGNERKYGVGLRISSLLAVGALAVGCTAETASDTQATSESFADAPTAIIAPVDNSAESTKSCNRPQGSGVLISFDDSGTPGQVDAILTELKDNNMRAAFFPTGNWAVENLDLIERMKKDGHIVGNHTQTHARLGELARTNVDQFYSEIYPLEGVANTDPMLLRHPYEDGAYDEDVAERLTDKNIQGCTWTADTHDWDGSSVDEMMNRLKNGDEFTRPLGRDGVVLAHMHGAHSPELVDALADHLTEADIPYEKLNH